MRVRIFAALAALVFAFPTYSQNLPTEADLRRHIEILASDAFEGRRPGTAGEALTVSYIAEQFSAAGILPGYEGHYFQPVALVDRADIRSSLDFGNGVTVSSSGDQIIALGNEERVSLESIPVIFVGYGPSLGDDGTDPDPDRRYDGQTVLLLRGSPDDADDILSFRGRLAYYRERGAAAIIGIAMPDTPWDAVQDGLRFRQTYLANQPRARVEAIISSAAADSLLAAEALSYDRLIASATRDSFVPERLDVALDIEVQTDIIRYDGINVVGLVPGSTSPDETVLFTAHHDHFGICRPEGEVDRICNGAVDNASGTAALIETARTIAAGDPPARTILFVTTTAEEDGLLGAQAFATEPPVDLENIVAAFNLDMIALAGRGAPVGIVGRSMTPLDPLIDTVSREQGRAVHMGTEVNEFVQRSDSWAFVQNGVPAVMVGGSFVDPEVLNGFLRSRYHRPDDEVIHMNLGGAIEDTLLHIALARAFADPERYPSPQR